MSKATYPLKLPISVKKGRLSAWPKKTVSP